jgi:hypothetical protein
LDLDAVKSSSPRLLASACKALPAKHDNGLAWTVEGVGETPAVLLISTAKPPRSILLEQTPLDSFTYDPAEGLLYVRFSNEARPRELVVEF